MTDQLDLDQIETRARELMRVSGLGYDQLAERLAQTDVPAMAKEMRRLRAELERRTEDAAFLERTTLPELRREIEHHKDGKQRWRKRAEKAEARVSELERITTPHTPRLCACGHSHHAHTVPAPHSCFAHGQTCPCEAYRQLPHDEAMAQLERNRQAAAERERAAAEETHVVADDSDDPEHVDDCPGCEAFTLTGHRASRQ